MSTSFAVFEFGRYLRARPKEYTPLLTEFSSSSGPELVIDALENDPVRKFVFRGFRSKPDNPDELIFTDMGLKDV